MAKDTELSVKIENEELVIRIGISALAFAVRRGPYIDQIVMDQGGDEDAVKITDEGVFAQAILESLHDEEEDGSTRVHRMLDDAAEYSIENGCEGIEIRESSCDGDE